jgi:hypothetical protein
MRGFIQKAFFIIFTFVVLSPLAAQERNLVNQGQYWLSYTLTKKIDDNWSAKINTEDRRYIINNRDHMFYILGDVNYKLNKNWSLGGGFMYFNLNLPSNPHVDIKVKQPEYRPYQRVAYGFNVNKTNVSLSLTVEERIRMRIVASQQMDDYITQVRFRNKVLVKRKLSNEEAQHPISLFVSDDYMLQAGKTVKGQPFDQNRFSVGLEYKAMPKLTLRGGYMNWYQEIANSTTVFDRNIMMFGIVQSL